ncbi:hypothetical protein LCGC14_0969610 [marine sediment metagenome]|uniref:Uncharacterized protein n=1 Tax=marine sediment metagenome TaxID=412755 RepID=A0A0F9RIE7_9ZZZZ|nr:hypothetical protein [Methylophaga sp.]HEC60130.1 hypothetical protein [Methylophaga sp.]
MKKYLGFLVLLIAASQTNAAIIQGDFRTESDLPGQGSGALVYEALNVNVGSGDELTNSDFIENPSSWNGGVVNMDLDSTTNILTLKSQDDWDFYTFDAWISNIVFNAGEVITGISLLSGNLTSLNLLANLSFADNSIHINYTGDSAFNFTGTDAQFQILTSNVSAVPIPAAALLFAPALLGFMGFRRKAKNIIA